MNTLRARYVFPVDRPPIENAYVSIRRGCIVEVGPFVSSADAIDLGDVAIIPGLINAHTHLEFSDLATPLGEPGMSLPWWIREVIKKRANANQLSEPFTGESTEERDPIQLGLDESARCGVTTVGEIVSTGRYVGAALDVSHYLELRALRKEDVDPAIREAAQFVGACCGASGLSPHAPYSVHRDLFHAAIDLARKHGKILVMHLAESREEIQLLQTSRGPFRDLLEERGWWESGAIPLDSKPLDYLEGLSHARRAMIIHGNYLAEKEVEFISENRDHMSVVYCPRTHAYFGHEPYPLWRMLGKGVRVALGTDSRASNPDLDLRKELQFVIQHHGLTGEQALRLGTIVGATAMGVERLSGSITNGKSANLAIIQLPNRNAADPHELLFDPEARVVATISRGRVVFSEHPGLAI